VRKFITPTGFSPEPVHPNPTFRSRFCNMSVNISLSLIKHIRVNRQGDVGVQFHELLNLTLGGGVVDLRNTPYTLRGVPSFPFCAPQSWIGVCVCAYIHTREVQIYRQCSRDAYGSVLVFLEFCLFVFFLSFYLKLCSPNDLFSLTLSNKVLC
jgi:hypothetical protein